MSQFQAKVPDPLSHALLGLLPPSRMSALLIGIHFLIFILLWRRPALLLAIGSSDLWGTTTVLEKLAIDHMRPSGGPVVALLGILLLVLFLTPGAFRKVRRAGADRDGNRWYGLYAHHRALALAALIAGMAALFGFTAVTLGLVGYVTTIFKLSAVLTILWAKIFLGEGQIRERLLGTIVMTIGGLLVAV